MENKSKQQPATHQPLQQTLQSTPHHQYHTRLHSPQPNGIVHQLLMQPPINYQPNSPIQDARSPLLENQQDLYGTRQPLEYSRHYGSRDSNYVYGQSPTQQRLEQRHLVSNPQYNHNIEHEVPKGYNAEVYNAYMRRNPPNNMEHSQIYQNHQSLYHQQSPEQQYTPSKPYLPYTNRIQSNTELLKQQYNEIQQMKLQQQMHYQNQAQMQQQHTFAQRQLMLQHIHGVQPPPNMQQSLYSDGSRSQKSLDDMIQLSSPHRDGREKTPVGANTSVSNVASPSSQTSPESTSPSVKSPSLESRRSSGGTQALRLPVAQRVMSAPVTMSGWLYKQGSDVLKVWRKRWFVLTDYCLFYYKSQDEEKLLGSVLLPSYTISACTPEDRVTKKHAFKCAHANMRTYVLAAPDQNLARRWCEVLTRASLMEEGSKHHQNRAARDPSHQAEGDDDAGSDDVAPGQPTYANAPPKPRRSNDGYHSPSPERYDPNYDLLRKPSSQYGQSTAPASPKLPLSTTSPSANKELENLYEARKSVPAQQPHYRSKQSYNAQNLSLPLTNTATDRLENTKSPASYNDPRNNVKTPNYYDNRTSESVNIRTANTTKTEHTNQQRNEQFKNEENIRNFKENKDERIENYDQLRQKERLEYPSNNSMGNERMTIERRTPDAYGRSAIVPGYYGKGKASDYEDIYPNYVGGDGYSVIPAYSRPLSPPSYDEKMGRSPGPGYESHQGYQMTDLDATQNYAGPPVLRRKKALAAKPQNNTVPRPHSADFLEYESKAQAYQPNVPNDNAKYGIAKQPPRPKSSLDINSYYDPSSDSYYSEESYAEKMRQSSQYLQRRGLSLNAKLTNPKSQLEQVYSVNLATANYSDPRSNAEGSYGLRTSDKEVLSCDSKYSESGLSSNWTLRDKNLSDYPNRSNSAMSESSNVSGYGRDGGSKQDLMGSDGFMRSASARLPSTGMDNGKDGERKVQQREESMKRLLEWKQRMLQSPLTRKSTPAALSLARTLNQTRLPAAKHQSDLVSGKAGSRYRHSAQQGNMCYNSYSSDDEASISASLTGYDPPHHPTAPPISSTTSSGALSASKKALVGSSGSLGRGTRECGGIPVRAVSPRVRWAGSEGGGRQEDVYGGANEVQSLNIPGETWSAVKSPLRHTPQPIRAVSPRVRRLTDDAEEKPPDPNLPLIPSTIHPDLPSPGQLDLMLDSPLTAGELLGRTHEERVLLLIQLRRRQTAAASALEVCAAQVAELQNILNSPSPSDAHPENYHRLEQLKRHLLDLEQQYEKSKPLVHLVDNMVKLGSLYNRPGGSVPSTIDRLERNQELRQRLLVEQADEQRRWASSTDSLSREHIQRKVEQLAALERQLAVEAGTLHGLRADRDAIERVLGGVRTKFGDMSLTNNSSGGVDPAGSRMLQLERRSEQQALEADLTRVHMMLAHNSKKLEQTVADNARLERELMGLRHKLQGHRMSEATMAGHGSVYDSAVSAANTTALLEDELRRVQQLVSDLQRQRQELSGAVRQLTDKSQNLAHSNTSLHCIGLGNMTNAEKQEIKTVRIVKRESERRQRDRERSVQPGAVDWSSNSNLNLDQMTEDDYNSHYNTRSTSLPRTFHGHNQAVYDDYYSTSVGSRNQPPNYLSLSNVNVPYDTATTPMEFSPKYPSSPSLNNNNEYSRDSSSFAKAFDYSAGKSSSTHYLDSPTDSNRTLTNGPLSKTSSVVSLSKTNAELSPIFKSEAARQIIIEMSGDVKDSAVHRRRVPREKRRHYTAPHHLSAKTLSELPGGDGFGYQEKCGGRSLDDVDMERALRAPPDVVRSALAPQRFAETTIDQLLAAPRKIVIPERYVPEKPPELSPEEQKKRLEKVESIKKMLSSTPSSDPSKSPDGEEKRQREHLLQMNQILAKQVMEMSKIVAGNGPDAHGSTAGQMQ